MAATIKYNPKKRTFTGTSENDVLDATTLDYVVPVSGKNKDKGLTIKGAKGDDEITGTTGKDTITGGVGSNVVNYTKGDGNDTIYLTKGENFTLNMKNLTFDDLRFEYANKNKDLRIYTSKTSNEEYITLKNFAKKDVTNNSNAKKGIADTSSVELVVGGKTYDLRTSKNLTDNEDVVLYKTTLGENAKNFTGTWLNDEIDTSGVKLYKKVKDGKKKVSVEKELKDTGLTLKGGVGNDTITGTKYSDKIYGNTGSDTINAGTGNNYIYFNKGDGHDIIENGNGIDTLVFAKGTKLTYDYYQSNLILSYGNNDKIVLKEYLNGHSVKYIKIGNITAEFKPTIPTYNEYEEGNYYVIEGSSTSDYIIGTGINTKIYGYEGDDLIYCSNGENKVYGGLGNDIIYGGNKINSYYFEENFGNDIIYDNQGETKINFMFDHAPILEKQEESNDLIIYSSKDKDNSIKIKNFFSYINKDLLANYCIGYNYDSFTGKYQNAFVFKSRISVGTDDSERFSMGTIGDQSHQGGYIFAGEGNDIIRGEQYNSDRISQYKMVVYADKGDDVIECGYERDVIYAGSGDDIITSVNPSQHLLYGGDGNDTYYINISLDNMHDTIYDSSGNDTLIIESELNNLSELYFNVYKNGEIDTDLYIKSGNKLSSITINEFLNESTIETIIINNGTKEDTTDDFIIHFNKDIFENIISDVLTWLNNKSYDSINAVINANNTEDINYIMQIYNQDWGIADKT